MTVESVVLTLQVSPIDRASDEQVRRCGSNPKIILRLMDTELVDKVYTHLTTKWNLPTLSLFCKGRPMAKTDTLAEYADLVSAKQSIVYQVDSTPATTAAHTPFCSPAYSDKVESIMHEIGSLVADPKPLEQPTMEETVKEPKKKRSRQVKKVENETRSVHSEVQTDHPIPGIQVNQNISTVQACQTISADQANDTIPRVATCDAIPAVESCPTSFLSYEETSLKSGSTKTTSVQSGPPVPTSVYSDPTVPTSVQSGPPIPTSVHSDREFFLSVLESQNNLFVQLQSQMTSAWEKSFRMLFENRK